MRRRRFPPTRPSRTWGARGSAPRASTGPRSRWRRSPSRSWRDPPTPLRPGPTRSLAAGAALAAALLAGRLARRRAFAIALVGWNPVLAVHLAGGGHNDAWVGALILAALALSASRRLQGAGALWAIAIGVSGFRFSSLRFASSRLVPRTGGRPTGLRPHRRRDRVGATVLYGGAWPLAILPLAGNAALETSYAIPHRLEQIGVPDAVALGIAVAALLGRPRLAGAGGPSGAGPARTGSLPRARDDPVSRGLVPRVGGAARRCGRGRGRDRRVPRPLRLPVAADDPALAVRRPV